MRQIIVCIFAVLLLTACSKQEEAQPEVAAEFGICYDARGCPTGQESAHSVTKSQCDASGGKSWKGGASGCVNL